MSYLLNMVVLRFKHIWIGDELTILHVEDVLRKLMVEDNLAAGT